MKAKKPQRSKSISDPDFLKIKIPEREDNKKVAPSLWYVIYEADLRNPRVLNMSFRDDYHAKKFCEQYLSEARYNIILGSELIKFGITKVKNRLSQVVNEKKKNAQKYSFHPELDWKKRKTLRTMYRRTLRRNLITLLNRKK